MATQQLTFLTEQLTRVEIGREELVEGSNVLAAASAEGVEEFESRLGTFSGGADGLGNILTQLLLLCSGKTATCAQKHTHNQHT